MRFSAAVNVVLLGVATIVSALPIAKSSSSIELESRDDFDVPYMFERDFDEPALYRRTQYDVTLHRSKIGTPKEHWRIRIHPPATHASASWHDVHALSNKEKAGVLETVHEEKGGHAKDGHPGGFDHTRHIGPTNHNVFLGNIADATKARKAAKSLKDIHCHQTFPSENCADWTKLAVDKLHADKHIDAAHKATFMAHYDLHKDAVRTTTGTRANKLAAGHT